ncbi:MAG: hypothetical protein LBO65_07140 [Spirochaetaceae bacterium]|jgi:hypothetical protein|nr:hypothetical protein [Spirochaetaceae bacterium]
MVRILVLSFVVTALGACGLQQGAAVPRAAPPPALALVRPGSSPGEPFWFELGPEGPRLIPSPGEASLNPFVPWNHARHITAFLPDISSDVYGTPGPILFAGVNRGGILGFEWRQAGTAPGEVAVYYHRGNALWEEYPLGSFFRYGQEPAALLGRDRFFSAGEQPVPERALWTIADGGLQELVLPALAAGWEYSALFQAPGGMWYYRRFLRDGEEGAQYFRTPGLSSPGERITAESFLEAAGPGTAAPALLTLVLDETERLAGRPCIVTVASAEYAFPRPYRSGPAPDPAGEEEPLEISGYYRSPLNGREGLAIVLLSDGRGAYGSSGGSFVRDGHISLPPLPEEGPGRFRYTAVAMAGTVLAAAWEEQRDWNIGAAGFLLLEIDL